MKIDQLSLIFTTALSLLFSFLVMSHDIQSLRSIEEDLFVGVIIWIGQLILKLGLIGLFIFSITFIVRKRQFGYVIPIIACLSTFLVTLIVWSKLHAREISPIRLKAHYDGDINGLTLTLKENLTYRLQDYSFIGGTAHFGEYEIKGDTIFLSEQYPLGRDRDIMSSKLLIRSDFILIKPDANGIYNQEDYLKLRITHGFAL